MPSVPAGHLPPPGDKPTTDSSAEKSKDSSGWLSIAGMCWKLNPSLSFTC